MGFDILSFLQDLYSSSGYTIHLTVAIGTLVFLFYLYKVAVTPSGIIRVNNKRKCLTLDKSYNPFGISADHSSARFSGIKCTLRCEKRSYVQALWGVPIRDLFDLLHKDLAALKHAISTSDPAEKFSSKCVFSSHAYLLNPCDDHVVEFHPTIHIDEETLGYIRIDYDNDTYGYPVRTTYPFVLLMVLDDVSEYRIQDASLVVAVAYAVHIRDRVVDIPSQLLGLFAKLSPEHVGEIKKIYLSYAETSDEDDGTKCIVCYQQPVSVVPLPCRHACLCLGCFEKVNRCPVCRAFSTDYFVVPHGR